jgi:hypothetical protein
MAAPESDAPGEAFVLHEDGTVTLGWDGFTTTLRRPKAGEWLSFTEEYEAANAWAGKETKGKKPTVREAVEGGPFRALGHRLIRELGGEDIPIEDIPIWLCLGAPYQRISDWWLASPLARQEAAVVARTMSR